MTIGQENEYSRFLTGRDFLIKHPEITSTFGPYASYFLRLNNSIERIASNRIIQEKDTKGVAASKTSLRVELADLGLDLSKKLVALFTFKNQPELLAQVSFKKSDFDRGRDTTISDKIQLLIDIATAHKADAATFDADAALIKAVADANLAYKASITRPKLISNESKAATEAIVEALKEGKAALNAITTLVEAAAKKHPEFAKGYANAIRTIKSGSRSSSLLIVVTDVDGNPIPNVSMVLAAQPGTGQLARGAATKEVARKTGPKGQSRIQNLPDAEHIGTFTKGGFKVVSQKFVIINGETKSVRIVMERE